MTYDNQLTHYLNYWEDKKRIFLDLNHKYSQFCDKSIQTETLNIHIPKITNHIKSLPDKYNSNLIPDHNNILKNIVKESENKDTIKSINNEINIYKSYRFDMSDNINRLHNQLESISQINDKYSKVHLYSDYHSLGTFPTNIANKLSTYDYNSSLSLLTDYISELCFKIEHYFCYDGFSKYYSVLAEFNACAYFISFGFNLENATDETGTGGVDLKVIDNNENDYFVEVYCPDIYYSDELKDCLYTPGASKIPSRQMADMLRKKILPDGKKTKQILTTATRNPNKKIYLWIDLTKWIENTKLSCYWDNPKVDDALCKIVYPHELCFVFDPNNSESGETTLITQDNKPRICDKLTGIIYYNNTDKKTKYIHNQEINIINQTTDFPPCDTFYFLYKNKLYCLNEKELYKLSKR